MAFDDEEYNDLYERRFSRRKAEYLEVKNVLKEIEVLEKEKNINFDHLSGKMQDYFIETARKYHQLLYAEDDDQVRNRERGYFINNYVGNNEIYRKLIRETLNEAKKKT